MSVKINRCPEKQDLLDYLLGTLPPNVLTGIEEHFAQCGICEETIRGLNASDTLSELVADAAIVAPEVGDDDKTFVKNLILQIQENGEAGTAVNDASQFLHRDGDRRMDCGNDGLNDRAAEVTRLLTPAENGLENEPSSSEKEPLGTIAHYRVLELIGAGSTGVVYRALDRQLDRMVALKILRPSLGQPARERFMAEARAAASIEHPNVVTIYHVGEENQLAFMAMKWLPGETLEDKLANVSFLPEEETREVAKQVASGLAAAHEKNLIHRDIKPANIWLSEESGQAIILDFGLARIADDDPQMTATGMLAGTPNFMSPEQTRGMELDGRSDLFSLGCLMYRAATGKLPFGASGILATLQSIQNHDPRPPLRLNPHLSEDFSDLVMCLIEKQPANRPESTSDLIDALDRPRSEWPFVATHVSSGEIEPKKPMVSGSGKRGGNRKGRSSSIRWAVAVVIIGLLGWGGFLFAPQIVRIATNHGELVIESNDAEVEINVLQGGELITVIDTTTKQSIDIKSGEYQIRIKDDRNGFQLSANTVVMTRGGKQIVSIKRVEGGGDEGPIMAKESLAKLKREHGFAVIRADQSKSRHLEMQHLLEVLENEEDTKSASGQSPTIEQMAEQLLYFLRRSEEAQNNLLDIEFRLREAQRLSEKNPAGSTKLYGSSAPTYDGNSFEQWASIIKTERNQATLEKALYGLAELARGDQELQNRAVALATPLVRLHGDRFMGRNPDSSADLPSAFNKFFRILGPQGLIKFAMQEIEEGNERSWQQLEITLKTIYLYDGSVAKTNDPEFRAAMQDNAIEFITHVLEHLADRAPLEARRILNSYLESSYQQLGMSFQQNLKTQELPDDVAELLYREIKRSPTTKTRTFLALQLLKYHRLNDQAMILIAKLLSDPERYVADFGDFLKLLNKDLSSVHQTELVQPLIRLYQNEEYCRLIYGSKLNGFIKNKGNPNDIRIEILLTLQTWGKNARGAVNWLESISTTVSPAQGVAKNALQQIMIAMLDPTFAAQMKRQQRIAIGVHNYSARMKTLPFGKKGELLSKGTPRKRGNLSWRGLIVHYLAVSSRIYVDPVLDWDSPTNAKSNDQMPSVFGKGGKDSDVFKIDAGGAEPCNLDLVTDGTSTTIMLMITKKSAPWMKPGDLTIDEAIEAFQNPPYGDYTVVAMYDASIRLVPKDLAPNKIRAFLTPRGGEDVSRIDLPTVPELEKKAEAK